MFFICREDFIMHKIYIVELSEEERAGLRARISKGKRSAQAILKARILLKADRGSHGPAWIDTRICEALETNLSMVSRVRGEAGLTEGWIRPVRLFAWTKAQNNWSLTTRTPLPMKPGQPNRYDHEYRRAGTANLFMLFAPLEGWRHVESYHQTRKAVDYAHILKALSDVHFPEADKITLVQDNLNIHVKASLYKAFAPQEARRPRKAVLNVIYTPKHGSWLNMAEIELAVLARQCLSRRIPDKDTLKKQSQCMAEKPKQSLCKGRLEVHNQHRQNKTKTPIPSILIDSLY